MAPNGRQSSTQFAGMQATDTGTILSVVCVHSIGIQQAIAEQLEHDALLAWVKPRDGLPREQVPGRSGRHGRHVLLLWRIRVDL